MTFEPSAKQFSRSPRRDRSLAIEGWRGINHSFALVNQHQILDLLKLDGLRLYHTDLPFAFPHWTRAANGSGFPPDQQALIDSLAPAGDEPVDCIYRIASPFRAGAENERCRTVTFMVTEFGLQASNFADNASSAFFTRDGNRIVTPSCWSRDRLIDWGFPESKIDIIHHGVDATAFAPLMPDERQARRRRLGFADDEIVFLNVGLSTWNKGVDLLLAAFATLRAAGRKVRLVVKDQRDLYGCSIETLIPSVGETCPALLAADTLGAISVIPTNLGIEDLRTLFAISDCYVSPYRAEGFNLPVLEAIASGTPVIVTRGGATDDFCDDGVAVRIEGTSGRRTNGTAGDVLHFIEPKLDDLVGAMESVDVHRPTSSRRSPAAAAVVDRFSWRNAARALAAVTTAPATMTTDGDNHGQ